jgi:hypothetical protein
MKCENNLQLHEALTALISGNAGTVRDALKAIVEYTDTRLPPVQSDYEKSVKARMNDIFISSRREAFSDRCCGACRNFTECKTAVERRDALKADAIERGNTELIKLIEREERGQYAEGLTAILGGRK